MPDWADPQSLNRYAFVVNNPLKYTDPSGHFAECGDADWEQEYRDAHNGEAAYEGAVEDCRVGLSLGATGWTEADWTTFYYAQQAGLDRLAAFVVVRLNQSSLGAELWGLIQGGPGIKIFIAGYTGMSPWGNIATIPNPLVYGLDEVTRSLAHEAVHVLQRYYRDEMRQPFSDTIESEREALLVEYTVAGQLNPPAKTAFLAELAKSYASAESRIISFGFPYNIPAQVRRGCYRCDWRFRLLELGFSFQAVGDIYAAAGYPQLEDAYNSPRP